MAEGALAGRRVLVTGGGRNIGRAVAVACARAGADVAVLEMRRGEGRETLEAVRAAGRRAAEVAADLRRPAAVARAFAAAARALGGLDGLVNNAAVYLRKPFLETTEAEWDRTLDTNLKGVFLATQAFARLARARGSGGAVVNLASIHATVGDGFVVAHCTAKAGVVGFTRAAAEALRADGIRVNAISPGAVATWSGPWDAPVPARPLMDMLVPASIAYAAVWLLSDAASGVTGADLAIPGGTATTLTVP